MPAWLDHDKTIATLSKRPRRSSTNYAQDKFAEKAEQHYRAKRFKVAFKEVQRIVKAMMGYGARMPKELMLYVKNMVFLDGAIARLAPDLDIIQEVTAISMLFAERHGERLGRELGIDHLAVQINMDSIKAGLGVETSVDTLTYRDLQARRNLIQKRMREHVGR